MDLGDGMSAPMPAANDKGMQKQQITPKIVCLRKLSSLTTPPSVFHFVVKKQRLINLLCVYFTALYASVAGLSSDFAALI